MTLSVLSNLIIGFNDKAFYQIVYLKINKIAFSYWDWLTSKIKKKKKKKKKSRDSLLF